MVIAALDTGMRQGEMLALRFKDIDLARGLITLRGETTKSRRTRLVPVATARLRAVLEWLQVDADGEKKPADALVFSDEAGEPVGRFRTAWVTAVLKAHDVAPVWKSYNWTALTQEWLAEFRRIDLRWHDLRHEYASRLVEKGVPLAQVRDLLGHASITTTERYDNQQLENLQAAAARLERGETFDPGPRESASPSICQVSVKSSVDEEPGEQIDRVREASPKYGEDLDLEIWLGGRDSNPDNVVQSVPVKAERLRPTRNAEEIRHVMRRRSASETPFRVVPPAEIHTDIHNVRCDLHATTCDLLVRRLMQVSGLVGSSCL
jgi:Phage integrase family